jgi:hypothetical protein
MASARRYRRGVSLVGADPEAAAAVFTGAIQGDPTFVLAAAALVALGRPRTLVPLDWRESRTGLERWEGQHLEVVASAVDGAGDRAAALLRDHLAEVRCDPVALYAVWCSHRAAGRARDELEDVLRTACAIHRASMHWAATSISERFTS